MAILTFLKQRKVWANSHRKEKFGQTAAGKQDGHSQIKAKEELGKCTFTEVHE